MNQLWCGDARSTLAVLPAQSVQMAVTSPPYFGLRDYGVDGQIGLETSVTAYVDILVDVFRGVRRVLRDDGTVWLNLGDSFAGGGKGGNPEHSTHHKQRTNVGSLTVAGMRVATGLKPKDLIGVPWRVAFALQADGWYLRSDIVWQKPNPMPESVRDRPTRSHEFIFLLAKSERYYYDADAIKEPMAAASADRYRYAFGGAKNTALKGGDKPTAIVGARAIPSSRNKRDVWTVNVRGYKGAHFATFPPALVEPCVLAGSRPGDVVLDPFFGSGAVGEVCSSLGRAWIGIDINPEYMELARLRTGHTGPTLRAPCGEEAAA